MDLMYRINQIYGGAPRMGQPYGDNMPVMMRSAFGSTDPASAYAGLPPAMPAMGGAQGLQPQPVPAQPEMGGAQGILPPQAPAAPDMGGAQGLTPPTGGLLSEPTARPSMGTIANGMSAFGRGQGEQGQRQGESQYAPLPSVMSAGPVGGRAGADINVLQYMRGFGRR